MELTASDEGIPTKWRSRTSLDRLIQKLMLIVRVTGIITVLVASKLH